MGDVLPKQAILIVNAMSRKGEATFDEAREKLKGAGVKLIEAHAVTDPEKMDATIKGAIAKAPMVIVGGGDGSLSSNVDHFVGQGTVFAVLPLGTANSFARTLGLPLDLDGAIDVIANGRRKRIDLGLIDPLPDLVTGFGDGSLHRRLGRRHRRLAPMRLSPAPVLPSLR